MKNFKTFREAVSPAQQAAIAISKKERGEKPKNERKLTPAELKKREKVAKAIERDNPNMPMAKKMAIATATAKKEGSSAQSRLDRRAAKHGLGSKERLDRIKKARDFFSKPPPGSKKSA